MSKLSREEGGRTKLIQYGRVLTLFLCLGQGLFFGDWLGTPRQCFKGFTGTRARRHHFWWYRIQTTVILTTGTMLLMWLGEQITDRGIGNGISLIITIGILARLPAGRTGLKDMFLRPAASTSISI